MLLRKRFLSLAAVAGLAFAGVACDDGGTDDTTDPAEDTGATEEGTEDTGATEEGTEDTGATEEGAEETESGG